MLLLKSIILRSSTHLTRLTTSQQLFLEANVWSPLVFILKCTMVRTHLSLQDWRAVMLLTHLCLQNAALLCQLPAPSLWSYCRDDLYLNYESYTGAVRVIDAWYLERKSKNQPVSQPRRHRHHLFQRYHWYHRRRRRHYHHPLLMQMKGLAYHSLSVFNCHGILLIWAHRVSLSSLIDSQNLVITNGQFNQTHGHHTNLVIHINREYWFVFFSHLLTLIQRQKEVHQSALFYNYANFLTTWSLLSP